MGYEKNDQHQKRDRQKNAKKSRTEWKGFIDLPLSEEDKAKLSAADVSADDHLGMLAELLENGYKVSFSPDPAHNCTIASATGQTVGCLNEGYTTSGRGPSAEGALRCLYYKITVVAHDGLWENVAAIRPDSTFG